MGVLEPLHLSTPYKIVVNPVKETSSLISFIQPGTATDKSRKTKHDSNIYSLYIEARLSIYF